MKLLILDIEGRLVSIRGAPVVRERREGKWVCQPARMGFVAGLIFGFGIGIGLVGALVYMMGRRGLKRIQKVLHLAPPFFFFFFCFAAFGNVQRRCSNGAFPEMLCFSELKLCCVRGSGVVHSFLPSFSPFAPLVSWIISLQGTSLNSSRVVVRDSFLFFSSADWF